MAAAGGVAAADGGVEGGVRADRSAATEADARAGRTGPVNVAVAAVVALATGGGFPVPVAVDAAAVAVEPAGTGASRGTCPSLAGSVTLLPPVVGAVSAQHHAPRALVRYRDVRQRRTDGSGRPAVVVAWRATHGRSRLLRTPTNLVAPLLPPRPRSDAAQTQNLARASVIWASDGVRYEYVTAEVQERERGRHGRRGTGGAADATYPARPRYGLLWDRLARRPTTAMLLLSLFMLLPSALGGGRLLARALCVAAPARMALHGAGLCLWCCACEGVPYVCGSVWACAAGAKRCARTGAGVISGGSVVQQQQEPWHIFITRCVSLTPHRIEASPRFARVFSRSSDGSVLFNGGQRVV
ncbi:hypothetical protein BD414DRAFT_81701 [Trametes punicea]|nr:hypothetical protein BD414DRAFT_81701 [Trametes punicea]